MVGYAESPIVYADVALTRSKVNVKVMRRYFTYFIGV